jgi:hypothetical protein
MAMTNHTPGPWRKEAHGDGWHILGNIGPEKTTVYVATAHGMRPNDACLIAAAPELLEALQGLVRYAEAVGYTAGMGKTQKARLDAALAAVAKATGGA